MDDKIFNELIEKYMSGTATEEETKRLLNWYEQVNAEANVWYEEEGGSQEEVRERMLSNIRGHMGLRPVIKKQRINVIALVRAASIALVVGIGLFAYFRYTPSATDIKQEISLAAKENRYIMLPDSSVVVLRPGSKIHYKKDFNQHDREITLVGEAYFDVHRNPGKPFLIHTDHMKVRVLGTSFTVKAYPEQKDIIVNVKKGKVQVENDRKDLAVLTAGQQVVYRKLERSLEKNEQVSSTPERWIAEDMVFDATPFRELADRLQNRYDVKIRFKNPALEGCPITGKFKGTESLDLVLEVINQTRGTNYSIRGREIEINGEGCN